MWRDGGGLLALWPLARRVHRGPKARQRPVRLFGRTAEYFTRAAGADSSFNPNGPVRNPAAPHGSWRVIRNGRGGFSLVELHEFLPNRWVLPRPSELVTEGARNCSLFAMLMRFAGRWSNRDADIRQEGEALNAMFSPPMSTSEVGWIAASVGRYRAQWIVEGRYQADPERQAERGSRSGAARRKRNASRDARIHALRAAGWTQARIAAEVGVSQGRVAQIISEPTQVRGVSGGCFRLGDVLRHPEGAAPFGSRHPSLGCRLPGSGQPRSAAGPAEGWV